MTYRTTVSGVVELSGVRLDGDVKIGVFMGAANRDPRQFADADSFDIDRPQLAASHVALGTGIHACVGQMIARGESEALFGTRCASSAADPVIYASSMNLWLIVFRENLMPDTPGPVHIAIRRVW